MIEGCVDLKTGQEGDRTGSYMSLVACLILISFVIASLIFSRGPLLCRAHLGDSSRRFGAGELSELASRQPGSWFAVMAAIDAM